MEPGADKLPVWVEAVAPLVLIAIIFLGGMWLRAMEMKARALEKRQMQANADKTPEP